MRNYRKIFFAAVLFSMVTLLPASQRSTRVQKYAVTAGGTLELSISSGDIVVDPAPGNEVVIEAVGVVPSEVEMEQTGNLVRVQYTGRGYDDTSFHVQLPDIFSLDLTSGGGDIEVTADLTGDVDVTSRGGDISFKAVSGSVVVTTSGGDIGGGNVSGDCSVRSQGGDVELGKVEGTLNIYTQGGDIRIAAVGASLVARTLGGDVEVGDVTGRAEVASQGGDLEIGYVGESADLKTAGGDVSVNGTGGDLVAKTAGGDLRLNDITGTVDAKTAGGDIFAGLSSVNGPSDFASAGGDVTLEIEGGATVEAEIEIQGDWEDRREEHQIRTNAKQLSFEEDPKQKKIRATYEVNGGGPTITVTTVNGSININGGRLR